MKSLESFFTGPDKMKREVLRKKIKETITASKIGLTAAMIAKNIKAEKRQVNTILYEEKDVMFEKHVDSKTWKILKSEKPIKIKSTDEIIVTPYFTPRDKPLEMLKELIDHADKTIYIQAYYFDSVNLADALIKAGRKGVKVKVILGRTNTKRSSGRDVDDRHGGKKNAVVIKLHTSKAVKVIEDCGDTNNHNKVIIIDGDVVCTGGLNFGEAASENADNLVVIKSKEIARKFIADWKWNARECGEPFEED